MAHFRRQALSRLCLEFAFEIDSNQSHLAHCHKNDDNDMTCIFFIIGDNDVVGEGLFDSEAKELKQVVLIWPISPKIFTEIKVMWMWKKELLLFSTIFLCMQIHASTDSMDDKRDSRQGLVVRRVTLSTAMSTENQLAGPHHRGNSIPHPEFHHMDLETEMPAKVSVSTEWICPQR